MTIPIAEIENRTHGGGGDPVRLRCGSRRDGLLGTLMRSRSLSVVRYGLLAGAIVIALGGRGFADPADHEQTTDPVADGEPEAGDQTTADSDSDDHAEPGDNPNGDPRPDAEVDTEPPADEHEPGIAEETDSHAAAEPDADESAQASDPSLQVMHTPVSSTPAGEPLELSVEVAGDWLVDTVFVEVSTDSDRTGALRRAFTRECQAHPYGELVTNDATGRCRIELGRTESGELLQAPRVGYWIGTRNAGGALEAHFASRESPWPLLVTGESAADERARKLARHEGHTSRFELRGDVTLMGRALAATGTGEDVATDRFSDRWGGAVLSYHYRTLGWLYAFGFGVGVMRGQASTIDGEHPDTLGRDAEPGFNWGYGEVDFELHRYFSSALKVILGASEEGFSAGGGALIRIGPLYATHFWASFEVAMDVGYRTAMGFEWHTVPRVPMGVTIELTQWPDTEGPTGVRMIYDATWEITDMVEAGASLGYATRLDGLDGGLVAGLNTALEF